jgi:large subunit ribosomal protein L14
MIHIGTRLQVSDNSGAKIVECIKVLNAGRSPKSASIGDIIIVSVKETIAKQKSKVEKGGIYKALIVETVTGVQRKDGSVLKFARNSVVILSPQGTPIGTRILGLVTYELRKRNQSKILSLASLVI